MRNEKLLPMLLLAGCVGHADLMVPHPLVTKQLSSETDIEKPMSLQESGRGLPDGVLTQSARITKMNDAQACFGVKLHSLRPDLADLRQLTAVLKDQPSGRHIEGAQIGATQRSQRSYEGLVPERQATGSETYCASRNADQVCQSWQTRPIYSTAMVPGSVTVYESTGEVCFAHEGLLTAKTQRVILDLHKIEMVGFYPVRVAGMDFRWGFSSGSLPKKND